MVLAIVVVGAIAQLLAWAIVASGHGSVWGTVGAVLVVLAAVAVAVEPPVLSGRLHVLAACLAGGAAGAALYAATAAFVALVRPWWSAFEGDAEAVYRRGDDRAGPAAVVTAGVVAAGEELFWRGIAQRELTARLGAALLGALVTLGAYVLVNVASRNLAILAGAVVGGAVWGALAWWSGGVLASVVAHGLWTMLMLARPVVGERR